MDTEQAKFEGWAIVEMMGHQREVGFVTTEYFGAAALFRVDTPEIPEREYELKRPEYLDTDKGYQMIPAGAKVKRVAIPAKSRLVSPGSLYAMTPCTEETARKAIEEMIPRRLILLSIPEGAQQKALPGETFGVDICNECGRPVEECQCPEGVEAEDEEYADDSPTF